MLLMTTDGMAAISKARLSDQLSDLRSRVLEVETGLLENLKTQKQARDNVKRIQLLMKLRQQERDLGLRRQAEMEATLKVLEDRRVELEGRIRAGQKGLRNLLMALERSVRLGRRDGGFTLPLGESERLEAPRRRALAGLVDMGVKDLEALEVDLADAGQIGKQIQEEKQQLAFLFEDLNEKQSVLELNRQLQADLFQKKHAERVAQLESYQHLKRAEERVESLLTEFNARRELAKTVETERKASHAMTQGVFALSKGQLPMPVDAGKVISSFGRAFDGRSKLYVFRKGIDIAAGKSQPVRVVSAGKVAYAGELPDYGKVAIVDHGDRGEHFYTLYAHLGELSRKVGDPVAKQDALGTTDDAGAPLYFEIRARNVAVNPLQWLAN